MTIPAKEVKEARHLSGADIGQRILDSDGESWRIVEVHHYPHGVCVDVHHPDSKNWATTEPLDEVEYEQGEPVEVIRDEQP